MAEDGKEAPRCVLDSNGCLKLSCMLRSFNAPISEEQAWAVCFQSAKCIVNEWNSDSGSCYRLADTSQVFIQKDGTVHKSTVRLAIVDGCQRRLASSEYVLVASLGVIIFNALDYGLCHDEERKLNPPLELLIDRMTSATSEIENDDNDSCSGDDGESQNADEGIEQDSGEDDKINTASDEDVKHKNGLTLIKVMEMCASHLSCPGQADSHYKAVCRALVAEALELSTFLENISNGTKDLFLCVPEETDNGTLDKLRIQDWARLWMQVIQQLRQGVKLKKVDTGPHLHPYEYELTPYEMLLDDIRSRRYKLNKVMVNGDIPPRVKKDAHALILEFIRSRPPLVPVSKRKLPPTPPRQLTLYEKLMASIKQQHNLKPTPRDVEVETSRTKLDETDITPQPHRRLIKVDLSLRLSSSFEDDDTDDIPLSPVEEPKFLPLRNDNGKPPTPLVRSNSHTGTTGNSERRHSISVCESPPKPCNGASHANGHFKTPRSSSHNRSDYWKASQWQSLECLSLTLEEVVHIRNVLTKAELESLITDPALYDDVLKGKVCFTCKQVRFSFFGPWGIKCKMCERTVCDKCSSKMRIPTEHFARIPVYMLSPTPSPPPEEESSSHTFFRISDVLNFSGFSPSDQSPSKTPHQATVVESEASKRRKKFRHSESVHVLCNGKEKQSSFITPQRKPQLQRSKTVQEPEETTIKKKQEDKTKGPLVPVCRECKVMVCNIISSSRDQISPHEKRKRNSRTWPHQRAISCATACMSPVAETPPSSPDDVFIDFSLEELRHNIPSAV